MSGRTWQVARSGPQKSTTVAFLLCDRSCDIERTSLHFYLKHHWHHEIEGGGALCVCGRRFGDPDAAAYHLFWATEDYNMFHHRCRGEAESPTSLLTSSFRSSAAWTVSVDDRGKTTGQYVLNYDELKKKNTKLTTSRENIPWTRDNWIFVDRNSKCLTAKEREGRTYVSRK